MYIHVGRKITAHFARPSPAANIYTSTWQEDKLATRRLSLELGGQSYIAGSYREINSLP